MCAKASICPIVGALGIVGNGVFAHRIVPARSHQVQIKHSEIPYSLKSYLVQSRLLIQLIPCTAKPSLF